MKKKIAFFSLALAIAIPTGFVFASEEEQSNGAKIEGVKDVQESQKEQNKKTWEQQREIKKQEFETTRETKKQELEQAREQKKLEFQDRKEKMEEAKCKNIESRIANRLNRYENNSQMLEKVYGNVQARISRLLERIKNTGIDTSKLEADIAILNGKIDKLKADHATFMTTLQESQSIVCGNSEGEFKGKIDEARKVPEIIRQDRQDIKNFFQATIKADLQEILKQLEAIKDSNKSGEQGDSNKQKSTPVVNPVPTTSPELLP